jgi:hypothetical protein
MMEFVNGKDDIPYIMGKNMFQTTNQKCRFLAGKIIEQRVEFTNKSKG